MKNNRTNLQFQSEKIISTLQLSQFSQW